MKVNTYRDEHSAPFNWATKSQQELRFEAGTPEYIPTESDASEQGFESLRTISPKNSTQMIRQSRGNPCYAKPVQIPQVPKMSAKSPTGESSTLGRKSRKPSVSPHRINNFVCETSPNRLILDFGTSSNGTENGSENGSDLSGVSTGHNSSTDCSSTRSSVGLLEKMKQKTKKSIKRSISSVSTKNRNKKENSSTSNDSKIDLSKCNPNSKDFINYKYSPTNSSMTLSSISIVQSSMTSLQSNQTLTSSAHKYNTTTRCSRGNSRQSSVVSFDKTDTSSNNSQNKEPIYGTSRRSITKPTHAPPPPPVKPPIPNNPPPPLPTSNGNSFGSRFTFDPVDSLPLATSDKDESDILHSKPNPTVTLTENKSTTALESDTRNLPYPSLQQPNEPSLKSNTLDSSDPKKKGSSSLNVKSNPLIGSDDNKLVEAKEVESFLSSIQQVKPAFKTRIFGSSNLPNSVKYISSSKKDAKLKELQSEKDTLSSEPITLEPNINLRQYKIKDKTETEDHNYNDADDNKLVDAKEVETCDRSFLSSIQQVKPVFKTRIFGSSNLPNSVKDISSNKNNAKPKELQSEKDTSSSGPMTLEPDLNLKQYKIDKTESEDHNSNDAEDKNLEVRPLEDFKVDLSVDVVSYFFSYDLAKKL